MEPKIIREPLEVDDTLALMGLDRNGLVTSIRYAESERALCTPFDPLGFAQYVAYAKCGRKLRESYVRRGRDWELDNSHNQAAIKNPKTKVRVVPCNFDEGAGNWLVTPSNRSPKGEVSRQKSMCNRTAWIPGLVKSGVPFDVDGYSTWILGMHIDDSQPTRAELSMPIDFDGQYFSKFATRIFFLNDNEPSAPVKQKSDDAFAVIDIAVRRK